jgi:5-methylcytosine-specific restriction endonuclease McrA
MMARPVDEWIGKTDTTQLPKRVWKRVLDKYGWTCQECFRDSRLCKGLERDHIIALINWSGEGNGNRESNLQPLCSECHALKTGKDMAGKAKTSRCKEMRPGYKREKKPSRFKETRERLRLKYNWSKRRYEVEP